MCILSKSFIYWHLVKYNDWHRLVIIGSKELIYEPSGYELDFGLDCDFKKIL